MEITKEVFDKYKNKEVVLLFYGGYRLEGWILSNNSQENKIHFLEIYGDPTHGIDWEISTKEIVAIGERKIVEEK